MSNNKNKIMKNHNSMKKYNTTLNIPTIDPDNTSRFEILNLIGQENNIDNLNYEFNENKTKGIEKNITKHYSKPKIYEKTKKQLTKDKEIDTQNEEDGWHVFRHKRHRKLRNKEKKQPMMNNNTNLNDIIPEQNEPIIDENTDIGKNLKFKYQHKVWVHGDAQDWSIESFDNNFFIIDSVSSFLQFFNNFHKFDLNTYSFYIMRPTEDGSFIEPTWEHYMNRNGGTCSLRIDIIHGIELFQQLCILIVNESLIPDMSLLNGISISKKTNWALIKLWLKDQYVDISKMLPYAIINSYPSLCIKTKANVPEY